MKVTLVITLYVVSSYPTGLNKPETNQKVTLNDETVGMKAPPPLVISHPLLLSPTLLHLCVQWPNWDGMRSGTACSVFTRYSECLQPSVPKRYGTDGGRCEALGALRNSKHTDLRAHTNVSLSRYCGNNQDTLSTLPWWLGSLLSNLLQPANGPIMILHWWHNGSGRSLIS